MDVRWDEPERFEYLARVEWAAGGPPLILVQSRDQRETRLLEVDVATGATTTDAFGNTVPVMAALPGIWGRLRHNGDPAQMPTLPANSGVTLYHYDPVLGGWSSDGVTLAPSYIANIGIIA